MTTMKTAWLKAIEESRIVRFNDGLTFKEFLSKEDAAAAVEQALANGLKANIVEPEIVDPPAQCVL